MNASLNLRTVWGSGVRVPQVATLLLLAAAGCAVMAGDSGLAVSDRSSAAVAPAGQLPKCTVNGLESSLGTLRCFDDKMMICDRNGAWRPAPDEEYPLSLGAEVCTREAAERKSRSARSR